MKRFAEYLAEEEAPATPKAEAAAKPRRFADYLAEAEAEPVKAAPEDTGVKSLPMSAEKKADVDRQIQAGMLPIPGGARTVADSILESNTAVGQNLADKTLMGVPGRVMRAAGVYGDSVQPIPQPGKGDAHRPEDYLPGEAPMSNLPAAALDMASLGGAFGKAGQAIGQAPASIARAIGAKEAQTLVRPSIQAAAEAGGAGALYSGADTALRGGTPGEVLASMPEGALANVAMSHLPAVAGKAEDILAKRVVANDLRPIKQMSKKGTLDKELIQFGGGDPEEGARQMADFVQRENLGPVLRQKGQAAVSQYEAAKDKVYEQDLKPIYEHAYAAEPHAAVSFDEIASRLRANIRKQGGNEHRLVEKAIDEIKARTELVSKTGEVPLETVLTNARDFQAAGHAGVVNFDAPPESKVVMRQVGQVLRGLANEKVADIYRRHPEAAQKLYFKEPANRPYVNDGEFDESTKRADPTGSFIDRWGHKFNEAAPADLRMASNRIVAATEYTKKNPSDPSGWREAAEANLDNARALEPFTALGSKWHQSQYASLAADAMEMAIKLENKGKPPQKIRDAINEFRTKLNEGKTARDPSFRILMPKSPGTYAPPPVDPNYPNAWARRYENFQEYAADVPKLLAEGNKRYSDFAKLEPMVREASIKKAGEKKWGLMNMLGHGMSGTVGGAAGYMVGGFPGAVAGTAAVEGARASYPYAIRAANASAGSLGGPVVPTFTQNPITGEAGGSMIAGAILAKYGQKGLDEYEKARARLREAKGR